MANVKSPQMQELLDLGLSPHSGEKISLFRSFTVPVLAAHADGVIYVVERFYASDIITDIYLTNTAITVGTDYDLGFYVAGAWASDEAIKDKDILFDGVDMSTARDVLTDLLGLGTNALNAADYGKFVWELAGDGAAPAAGVTYDLCLTANVVGSADGTIKLLIGYISKFEQGAGE